MQTATIQKQSNKDPIFVPKGAGERVRVLGSTHINKVAPEQTGGAFSAIEIVVPPGMGPPMHTHANDCEFFYVLEGEITFEHPGGTLKGRPGDFVFLPNGGHHAFRNDGDIDAKALIVISPGVEAHHFFQELDHALGDTIDGAVAVELGNKNGIYFD